MQGGGGEKPTPGGVYVSCIYLHARWGYRRRFRSLLSRPLSVERNYFPLLILHRRSSPILFQIIGVG